MLLQPGEYWDEKTDTITTCPGRAHAAGTTKKKRVMKQTIGRACDHLRRGINIDVRRQLGPDVAALLLRYVHGATVIAGFIV